MSIQLEFSCIRVDYGVHQRAAVDRGLVEEWAELGVPQEPVVVFLDDEGAHWLADGFHRVAAHVLAGATEVSARVQLGTRRDAVLFACEANTRHGLRATYADKRKAVLTLLADPEWSQWSDREIGRRCGVGHSSANRLRHESGAYIETRTYQRLGGVHQMDVKRLASSTAARHSAKREKKAKAAPAEPAALAAPAPHTGPVVVLRARVAEALKAREHSNRLTEEAKTNPRQRAAAATAWREAEAAEKRVWEVPVAVLAEALGITLNAGEERAA